VPHHSRPTVTLHDVARAAGVSVATASRVLGGGSRRVAEDYRHRVLDAATALSYSADLSARAMRRDTDFVALVTDDLTTYTMGVVVAAMERQARQVNAFVSVAATGGIPSRQLDTVRTLVAFRPRALVLTSSRIAATAANRPLVEELREYERRGGRVAIYGSIDLPFDSIRVDDHASARQVGEHLAATGHRRPLILAGDPHRAFAAGRTAGYVEGLVRGGVRRRDIRTVQCAVSRQGGFDAASARRPGTDAVVAVNDAVAIGALSACHAAAVPVPELLSVTGFDDIPLAVDVTPRLTTVALPHAEIGARAVRLALSDRDGSLVREVVTGRLVERGTTASRQGPTSTRTLGR
jgi:LacI family transcriptional regulator